MDFFIKKIFEDNIDEPVRLQFEKYGRGEYKNRALVQAKKQAGNKYAIGTSAEYSNELVRTVSEKLGSNEVIVKGVVITTHDLTGKLKFIDKKQFGGVKKYIIDIAMTGDEIVDLCDKFPKCFFGLSFKTSDTELKIRPKAPKTGKPASKGNKEPKADFCKIKTTDINLVKSLLFDIDVNGFKEASVNHTFHIDDIILPEGETDPLKIRENAKRIGKITRKKTVDEKEDTTEKKFEI